MTRNNNHFKRFFSIVTIVFAGLAFSGCEQHETGIAGSGTIEATTVTVSTRVSGEILEMTVKEGEYVHSGDVLAQIDPTDLQLELNQVEQTVVVYDAQLALLLAGAREEDLQQARAGVEQARESLELAERTLARATQLYEGGSTTSSELDQAQTQYELARSRETAARAALEKLVAYARPEEIRVAEAQLAGARAAEERVREHLEQTTVTAPQEGIIIVRAHEPGELAVPGTPLYRIADLSVVTLTVYLPGPQIASIRLNQEALVTVDGLPDRRFSGRVSHIADEAEFTPKNVQTSEARSRLVYAVEITLSNDEGIFKIGMPADAILEEE